MHFFRFVGIVPVGVGLTLLFGLWTGSGPFGMAPTMFKIMGSFVALMFLFVGSGFLFAKIDPEGQMRALSKELQRLQRANQSQHPDSAQPTPSAGYQCSSCGAHLDDNAEVSPHGDVKCDHCGRWFNIHKV